MADDQDEAQKTEEPTQRKLDEAHRKGQVATSQEVKHWFMLLGILLIFLLFLPYSAGSMTHGFGTFLSHAHDVHVGSGAIGPVVRDLFLEIGWLLLLPMLVLVFMAVAAGIVQHGWVASAESLKPQLSKISLLKGLKRQFSLKAIAEFVKGILKLAVVGLVVTLIMMPEFHGLEQITRLSPALMMERTWLLSVKVIIVVLAVMTLIAGLDFLYQRFEFHKQQRMSKQEVKDEFKQTEGDPLVRARLRQIRTERARRRMMAAVPEADVVITNPTHFAVALRYDPDTMNAPRCLAKGADSLAQRIRAVAREHDVPVVENRPLAQALFQTVELDQEIPVEHYKAVAEIISYVFRLQRRPMPAAR